MIEKRYNSPFNSLTSVIVLVLFFVALFYIARAAFWLLSIAAPVMLIATLIIDHTVVTNYGKWIINQLKTNLIFGIGAILLTVFGFPIVAGFLLAKALIKRKFKKVKAEMEAQHGGGRRGDFIEYEEIQEEPPVMLELPELKKRREPIREQRTQRNEYDDLFDN